ncbi:MAG: ZIP family metal transporter [Clostridiales bacterium]|jgi:zinc and cadmium transporter|nr:ZIP family metal transporter [Clostridiales bacterium]
MDWFYVICAGLGGGLLSLLLGLALINNKKESIITSFATAFAAGTLLAAAFFDLLHEAVEIGEETQVFGEESVFFIMGFAVLGILIFFVLETLLSRFHSHARIAPCEECVHSEKEHSSMGLMITIGDSLHNFMDGIAIAAGFLISPISGLIITLAIMAHEIPQEVGDIAIMRASGMSKKKAIWLNVVSSLASLAGALIFFGIGKALGELGDGWFAPIFAIVAGFFIYIAATDIIPTLHEEKNRKIAIAKMLTLIAGVIVLALLVYFLHPLIEKV